jgi:capsular polysaccharide transport system permease protein
MAFTVLPPRTKRTSSVYFTDHLLIIRALILRNARVKFRRSPIGILLEFFLPTLSCVAHYLIFWATNRQMPPGTSLEQFIWAAFAVWLTFSHIYHTLEKQATAKAPPIPGITTMHVRFAHCAWNILFKAAFLYGSVALMIIFGDDIRFPNVPLTAFILSLSAILGAGLGMSIDGICRVQPIFEPIFHVLSYLLFITTGIYFSVPSMPQPLARFFLYNPLLHLVEYERHAFNPGYPVNLVSLSYPAAMAAGLLLFGLLLNRRLRYVRARH